MRRMEVPVALAAAGWMLGCAADADRPTSPARPAIGKPVGLFTLKTDLGPLDVLSFHDSADGVRTVRVHRVTPIGEHQSPEIRVIGAEGSSASGGEGVSYALLHEGVESCRLTRRFEDGLETEIDVELREGTEALSFRAARAEGGVLVEARLNRGGERTSYTRLLDRSRAGDPAYVAGIRDEIREFCPAGPLTRPDDLALLYAVVGSADWGNRLVPAATPGRGVDPDTARRMRVGCAISAVVGKLSCFAARFNPWPWVLCVPAEAINFGCLAYSLAQIVNPEEVPERPLPPPCGCPCGCGQ